MCIQKNVDIYLICGKHNIVTIGYSGARESQAHQPQEHVVIDEMLECIEGYTSILKKLYKI